MICRTWRVHFAFFSLILLGVFSFFGIACEKQPARSPGQVEKITLAYSKTPIGLLPHIALEKGYFLAEGVDVSPQYHEFGARALQAMLESRADLAISTDTPVMFAVTGGKKILILTTLLTSERAIAIVARKDRGISVPSNLEGKRIGVLLKTAAEFFLHSFFSVQKLNKKNIHIIDMKPSEMYDAITRGNVDAVCIWNPILHQIARSLKDRVVTFYYEHLYSDIACLSALGDFVRKHPETIQKVLKALVRGEEFVRQNPGESKRILATLTGEDPAHIEDIWKCYRFKVMLDQSLLASLEDQTRWARKNKLIASTHTPNYLDVIYMDGLQAVNPAAVQIIR